MCAVAPLDPAARPQEGTRINVKKLLKRPRRISHIESRPCFFSVFISRLHCIDPGRDNDAKSGAHKKREKFTRLLEKGDFHLSAFYFEWPLRFLAGCRSEHPVRPYRRPMHFLGVVQTRRPLFFVFFAPFYCVYPENFIYIYIYKHVFIY